MTASNNSSESKRWTADAPSNIALIKYMGKVDADPSVKNRPTNSSLSFTLPHLRSYVQLELDRLLRTDVWEPLTEFKEKKFTPLKLSEKGSARFLAHLSLLRDHYKFSGHFRVRSANDFPSDCGLASSASSFAALTKTAMIALSSLTGAPAPNALQAANFSRLVSGSSCRSFFEPWSIWSPDDVRDVPQLSRYGQLIHQVVVVNEQVKAVSSSEAHRRVATSLLFAGRPPRAELRLTDFVSALEHDKWKDAFEIAWAEFWDMHALFETSEKPFGYMTGGSLEVLNFVRDKIWAAEDDGPLVTMDAGPNVHLLYKNDERGRRHAKALVKQVHPRFKVLSSVSM
jgi:diphosphomevalonate decarboxylase